MGSKPSKSNKSSQPPIPPQREAARRPQPESTKRSEENAHRAARSDEFLGKGGERPAVVHGGGEADESHDGERVVDGDDARTPRPRSARDGERVVDGDDSRTPRSAHDEERVVDGDDSRTLRPQSARDEERFVGQKDTRVEERREMVREEEPREVLREGAQRHTEQKDEEFAEEIPRVPTPEPFQQGGYLVFTHSSDGSLILHFANSKVDGALAYFRSNKPIPGFKFTQNAGRVEIIRKLQNYKEGYFEGFLQFIKMAREFDGDLYIFEHAPVRVFYQDDGIRVLELKKGVFLSTKKFFDVAVIPPLSSTFDGVKTLSKERFIGNSNKVGKAMAF